MRLLARTLVVAGAAAAGTSVGWFAGHAGADPAVPGLPLSAASEPAAEGATGERGADVAEHRSGSTPPGRPVGAVVHHITEPLARAAAPDSTDTGGEAQEDADSEGESAEAADLDRPTESEVDTEVPGESADPGRFSLDSLAPQRLVGRVTEAKPVATVVHGADSLLSPVRGALTPDPNAEHPGKPLGALTRPVSHGLHQLTSPLWNHPAPERPAPPAPAETAPVETAPATGLPLAPPDGLAEQESRHPAAPAATATAALTAADSGGTAIGWPAAPGQDRPWTPGKSATLPLPVNGATGHAGDGSGGSGGVGLALPMPPSPAHLAGLSSLVRTAISAPGSAFAASPGTTPD
ncbi:hypothetical protein [Saccharopolyspora gloriosae]|uniref:hypothetical protein n=1 Tax=Saccharopolyspora gloriosae TaxID=455344 RepID=UPI001FB6B372|nr:hypothetical protein [Saccharopolyspora gloriosae]